MVHRQQGDTFGVDLAAKFAVLIAASAWATIATCRLWFGDIFGAHVAHQRPAVESVSGGRGGQRNDSDS